MKKIGYIEDGVIILVDLSSLVQTPNAMYLNLDKKSKLERKALGFYDVEEPGIPEYTPWKQKPEFTEYRMVGDIIAPTVALVDLSLEEAKALATQESRNQYEAARRRGFETSEGIKMDADDHAVANMVSKLEWFRVKSIPDTHEETIMDYNNEGHVKIKPAVVALFTEVGAYVEALKTKKWDYRKAIASANQTDEIPGSFVY